MEQILGMFLSVALFCGSYELMARWLSRSGDLREDE